MTQNSFATSPIFKSIFRAKFEAWQKRTGGTLERLASLCGVTPSYLGHVKRYGRVPGKPVLILLSLVLEIEDVREFFEAAGVKNEWPYESAMRISRIDQRENGFISLQVDMQGLSTAIAEVIRAEFKPRSLIQLTRGKPLRVGLNVAQSFLCGKKADTFYGAFPELMKLILLSAQQKYVFKDEPYAQALERLQSGDLDIYGPLYSTPKRLGQATFSFPFCRVSVAALWRKRSCAALPRLPQPRSLQEVVGRGYEVSVLKDSSSHDFALTVLGVPESRIIVCPSPKACIDSVILAAQARPAHLLLADAPIALDIAKTHAEQLEVLFDGAEDSLGFFENAMAIRPDWPELQQFVSETVRFLRAEKTIQELISRCVDADLQRAIVV